MCLHALKCTDSYLRLDLLIDPCVSRGGDQKASPGQMGLDRYWVIASRILDSGQCALALSLFPSSLFPFPFSAGHPSCQEIKGIAACLSSEWYIYYWLRKVLGVHPSESFSLLKSATAAWMTHEIVTWWMRAEGRLWVQPVDLALPSVCSLHGRTLPYSVESGTWLLPSKPGFSLQICAH